MMGHARRRTSSHQPGPAQQWRRRPPLSSSSLLPILLFFIYSVLTTNPFLRPIPLSLSLSLAQIMNGVEVVGEGRGGRDAEAAATVGLEELRRRMADFARERDWEQFHSPRNLLLALVRLLPSSPSPFFFPKFIPLFDFLILHSLRFSEGFLASWSKKRKEKKRRPNLRE